MKRVNKLGNTFKISDISTIELSVYCTELWEKNVGEEMDAYLIGMVAQARVIAAEQAISEVIVVGASMQNHFGAELVWKQSQGGHNNMEEDDVIVCEEDVHDEGTNDASCEIPVAAKNMEKVMTYIKKRYSRQHSVCAGADVADAQSSPWFTEARAEDLEWIDDSTDDIEMKPAWFEDSWNLEEALDNMFNIPWSIEGGDSDETFRTRK